MTGIDKNRLKLSEDTSLMLVQTTCMTVWSHYFGNYRNTSFCTLEQMLLLIIHQLKFWIKFLSWKCRYRRITEIQKGLRRCKIFISTPTKWHNYGKASLTISHLSKKIRDLSVSVVEDSNIKAFYLNSGGLHLDDKGLRRLAINLKLKTHKLWCEPKPVNDNYKKEILEGKLAIFRIKRFNLRIFNLW